jgi:hypothetical protein
VYAKPAFFDMSAGKGDSPRPVNGHKYRANYDRIFLPKKPKKPLIPMPTFANICQHIPDATPQHLEAPNER